MLVFEALVNFKLIRQNCIVRTSSLSNFRGEDKTGNLPQVNSAFRAEELSLLS